MKSILTGIIAAAIIAAAAPRAVVAQERQGPPLVPLKLQLVLSRQSGENKKISSVPYTLFVTANERRTTNLRMGVEVAIPTTVVPKEGPPQTTYQYRPVGTDIDCSATTASDGMFNVNIILSDSSVMFFQPKEGSGRSGAAEQPTFRSFRANFTILLKDGQTAQYTTATDPVSGEVLKVDATLTVLK